MLCPLLVFPSPTIPKPGKSPRACSAMSHASHVSKALGSIPAATFLSTAPLFTLEAGTSLRDALKALSDRGITGAPVFVDDVTGVGGVFFLENASSQGQRGWEAPQRPLPPYARWDRTPQMNACMSSCGELLRP